MTAERADDRRLLHALARVADLVLVVDRSGVITVAGPSTPASFGFTVDEAIGMNALDLVHPDDVLLAIEALTSSSEKQGRMEPLALRARDASGGWRSVELVTENCLEDPDIAGMVVTVRDLTGRAEHERALMERDDRYRQVVEMAAEGVWTTDATGLTTFVTGRMAAMLGYTPEQMVGRSAADFVAYGDQLAALDRFERRQLGISEQFEFPLRHRDGHTVRARVSSTPMIGPTGEYLGGIDMISDVTDLEDERRRLAASEATHAALIDAVPDLLFHLDADGRFLGYHGDADLLVRSPEAFLDRSMWDVLPQPVAERVASAMEEARATGSVVTLEYGLDIGGVVLTFEGRVSPMDDDEVLVLARDVTELRAAQAARLDLAREIEARRSAEAVRRGEERADRLDSLSRLAGGVAHDINNLLGVIGNYTAVLRRSVTEPTSVGDLDEIEAAVRRGSSLTRRLMLFGRRRLTEPVGVRPGCGRPGRGDDDVRCPRPGDVAPPGRADGALPGHGGPRPGGAGAHQPGPQRLGGGGVGGVGPGLPLRALRPLAVGGDRRQR